MHTPPSRASAIAFWSAAIAGSAYAEVDAGHVMFFEQEDAFVKLVADFIESPATTGGA